MLECLAFIREKLKTWVITALETSFTLFPTNAPPGLCSLGTGTTIAVIRPGPSSTTLEFRNAATGTLLATLRSATPSGSIYAVGFVPHSAEFIPAANAWLIGGPNGRFRLVRIPGVTPSISSYADVTAIIQLTTDTTLSGAASVQSIKRPSTNPSKCAVITGTTPRIYIIEVVNLGGGTWDVQYVGSYGPGVGVGYDVLGDVVGKSGWLYSTRFVGTTNQRSVLISPECDVYLAAGAEEAYGAYYDRYMQAFIIIGSTISSSVVRLSDTLPSGALTGTKTLEQWLATNNGGSRGHPRTGGVIGLFQGPDSDTIFFVRTGVVEIYDLSDWHRTGLWNLVSSSSYFSTVQGSLLQYNEANKLVWMSNLGIYVNSQ
jgi:hypothetical protein